EATVTGHSGRSRPPGALIALDSRNILERGSKELSQHRRTPDSTVTFTAPRDIRACGRRESKGQLYEPSRVANQHRIRRRAGKPYDRSLRRRETAARWRLRMGYCGAEIAQYG